ncbi:MAG: type II toxin-antitoxin system RelB/DinJ family antitoxin [Oscillospiraceae bacterium]|nr:type II toxin-antitoxin system RelB/DinJ family antitoxin [Oscillospiraceae bacterium]
MADTTNLSIRLDKNLKNEADQIFGAMGMSLTTAITVFVRQAVRQRKIPFEISLSENENRAAAMRDATAATERIWQNAAQNSASQMSLDEINTEIAAYRAERRARRADA